MIGIDLGAPERLIARLFAVFSCFKEDEKTQLGSVYYFYLQFKQKQVDKNNRNVIKQRISVSKSVGLSSHCCSRVARP